MSKKNTIRITESELKKVISESIKDIIKKNTNKIVISEALVSFEDYIKKLIMDKKWDTIEKYCTALDFGDELQNKWKPLSEYSYSYNDAMEWLYDDELNFLSKMSIKPKYIYSEYSIKNATTISPFLISMDNKNFYRCDINGKQISPTYIARYYTGDDYTFFLDNQKNIHETQYWLYERNVETYESKPLFKLSESLLFLDIGLTICVYNKDTKELFNADRGEYEGKYDIMYFKPKKYVLYQKR